jgi:nucleotide-binding universal stress UspA family protein
MQGGFHNETRRFGQIPGLCSRFRRSSRSDACTLIGSAAFTLRDRGGALKRLSRVICAVAIDDRDRHVFAHALALARRYDANLLVLHAASPEIAFNQGATERVHFLRTLRALADAAGVDVRVAVQRGPVAEIILLHARARNADLIVMGTGRKESRRGLSGWIAEQVLRGAHCPTLVVPEASEAPALFERILCAADFSPASRAAIREAVQLSEHRTQPITLLHVVDRRAPNADALEKLQSLIPQSNARSAVARVAIGRPVTEILRAARHTNAQLIVIGAARRTRIGSRLFGNTGQLLRDTELPILAVPVRDAANAGTDDFRRVAA